MVTAEDQRNGHNGSGYADFNGPEDIDWRPKFEDGGSGGKSEDDGKDTGFSKYLVMQAASMHTKKGIMMQGRVKQPEVIQLFNGLLHLDRIIWDAPAYNRQGRWDAEEDNAQKWQKQMVREDAPDGLLDDLMDRWHAGGAFCLEVEIREEKYGLHTVEEHRDRYRAMQKQQESVIFEASGLPPAHNQFFLCRIRQRRIEMEHTKDDSLGIPIVDFTAVKERLRDGKSIHDCVDDMSWCYQEVYNRVFLSVADGDEIRKWQAILYTREWPWEDRAPSALKEAILGFGDRDDNDDDDDGGRWSKMKKAAKKKVKKGKDD